LETPGSGFLINFYSDKLFFRSSTSFERKSKVSIFLALFFYAYSSNYSYCRSSSSLCLIFSFFVEFPRIILSILSSLSSNYYFLSLLFSRRCEKVEYYWMERWKLLLSLSIVNFFDFWTFCFASKASPRNLACLNFYKFYSCCFLSFSFFVYSSARFSILALIFSISSTGVFKWCFSQSSKRHFRCLCDCFEFYAWLVSDLHLMNTSFVQLSSDPLS
jgi:hypothetical protein